MKGHVDIVRHLVELGADTTARERLSGFTPLQLAIQSNQRAVFDLLVKYNRYEELETENYAGCTAYAVAYKYGKQDLADELVKCGAKPSVPPAALTDEEDSDEDEYGSDDGDEYNPPMSQMNMGAKPVYAGAWWVYLVKCKNESGTFTN